MTDILNILQLALGDIALSSHNSAFPSYIHSGVSTLRRDTRRMRLETGVPEESRQVGLTLTYIGGTKSNVQPLEVPMTVL